MFFYMEEEHKHGSRTPKSVFECMPSKFAFWAGFVTAVAAISLIGLITMISLTVKGVDMSSIVVAENSNTATKNTNSGTAKNTNSGSGAAAATGSVDMDALTHVKGEGNLIFIEYSDPECPYCQRHRDTVVSLEEQYSGKMKFAYKPFPLESLHPTAPMQMQATECADDQGKYWEFLDKVFELATGSPALQSEDMTQIASDLGMDTSSFEECLTSEKYKTVVNDSIAEAQGLGGSGTPFSVLTDSSGKVLATFKGAQPLETIAASIDTYL